MTQGLSILGSRVSSQTVAIWVLAETGKSTPLVLVSLFAVLPQVLAAGIGGILADKNDRRNLMMIANVGYVICSGILLLSFMSGAFQIWYLYALAFLQSCFGAIEAPALQASVASLVQSQYRDRANAIQQIAGPASGVIAPAVSALLYSLIGVTGALMLVIASFVAALSILSLLSIPMPAERQQWQALGRRVKAFEGLCYLFERRMLFALLVHTSIINFFVGSAMVLVTPYVLFRTGNVASFGFALAALNLGGVVGGLAMGVWGGSSPRIHSVMLAVTIAGILLAVAGMAQTSYLLAAAFFAFMFVLPFANASVTSIFQTKVAAGVQGRVFAAIGQISILLTPIAYSLAGPLADQVFEPAAKASNLGAFASLVGHGAGSGIGLLYVIIGLLTSLITVAFYAHKGFRCMEADLPDAA